MFVLFNNNFGETNISILEILKKNQNSRSVFKNEHINLLVVTPVLLNIFYIMRGNKIRNELKVFRENRLDEPQTVFDKMFNNEFINILQMGILRSFSPVLFIILIDHYAYENISTKTIKHFCCKALLLNCYKELLITALSYFLYKRNNIKFKFFLNLYSQFLFFLSLFYINLFFGKSNFFTEIINFNILPFSSTHNKNIIEYILAGEKKISNIMFVWLILFPIV
jgi:hypothetical protein